MPDPQNEEKRSMTRDTEIALLKQKLNQMETHLEANDAAIAKLIEERDHALKWGIVTLGTAVIAMGVWIFNFVTGHPR